MQPIVLLTGFSTAGKSSFLKEMPSTINCIDTDKAVAEKFGCEHIYEVYMKYGRDHAGEIIQEAEQEVLTSLERNDIPALVAAGPFLMLRDTWHSFHTARNPCVIHLVMTVEDAYEGLMRRRAEQLNDPALNQADPNFGSWDLNVTTVYEDGKYVDIPRETAIRNIRQHLEGTTNRYREFQDYEYNALALRTDQDLRNHLIGLISRKLGL